MENIDAEKTPMERAAQDLFNFAIDPADIHEIVGALHPDADIKKSAVAYELPLLKIITVGWSISYFINHPPYRQELSETYWNAIREFAHQLSETTGLMTGTDIDYFQEIKDRLDMYVDAMNAHPDAPEPAVIIGPEFAGACGNQEDVFTVMAGSRLFIATAGSVKSYLEEVKLR